MFISLPLLGHGGTDAVHADVPRHGRPAWADGADDAVSGAQRARARAHALQEMEMESDLSTSSVDRATAMFTLLHVM